MSTGSHGDSSLRWRFWGGEMAILGRRLRVAFLALCVHWGSTGAAVSALLLLTHAGRSVERVLAAAGELLRAPERSAGRYSALACARVPPPQKGGVLDVGRKCGAQHP